MEGTSQQTAEGSGLTTRALRISKAVASLWDFKSGSGSSLYIKKKKKKSADSYVDDGEVQRVVGIKI